VGFVVIVETRKVDRRIVIWRNDIICIRFGYLDNKCVFRLRGRHGSERGRGPVGIASPSVSIERNVESKFLHFSLRFVIIVVGRKELAVVNLFLGAGFAFVVISIGFPKLEFFRVVEVFILFFLIAIAS
jgi:hypothetical protein